MVENPAPIFRQVLINQLANLEEAVDLLRLAGEGVVTAKPRTWARSSATSTRFRASGGRLIAPMPGKIIAVLTEPGATVTKGQPLVVMEAMKMEHTIKAPADGTVEKVRYAVGDQVEDGAELIGFAEG